MERLPLLPLSLPSSSRRRLWLQVGALVWLAGAARGAHGAGVVAVRLWPAPDYTRVAIETDGVLPVLGVRTEPNRLTVELEGSGLLAGLQGLASQLRSSDPNIAAIQVVAAGGERVRLSLELKQAVLPQVFHLPPVAAYQHRLVVDLYPAQAVDPLEQLVAQRLQELDAASARAAQLLGGDTGPVPMPAPPLPEAADPLGALIAQRAGVAPSPALPASPTPASPATLPAPARTADDAAAAVPAAAPPHPATRTPGHAPGRPGAGTERLIVVALDPGHGGEDPGAIGPAGTYEKDVVLQIALKLRERIHRTRVQGNPMRAYMTRDADFFVPLGVRVQKARRVQADLFISLHADAFTSPQPAGASVFALSTGGATSATARWMADRENASDRVGGVNVRAHDAAVQRTLLDMSTSAQIRDSLRLGEAVLREMGGVGRLHKPRVEQAGFAVLKAPDIPSVLVETAFISNPQEERRLRDEAYQNRLADALLRGIVRYFEANPPLARNRPV